MKIILKTYLKKLFNFNNVWLFSILPGCTKGATAKLVEFVFQNFNLVCRCHMRKRKEPFETFSTVSM